ncbi:hypothetical protein [Sinorhizobium sp. NFACC03]|uniref:hypothetical protein n=1 Tax=Sinorhizobium sp. NFACC03 TaxID=1566295 RepID=UPI00088DEF5E|nr:hypothetical protein [Sinorhizobium sp. NFACC03]SDA47943.1 hypothetical protein SAMN03159448_00906 [Sinorhizobium sp. NFACC03]
MTVERSIAIYISEGAAKRLALISAETGRLVEELAECSIEEAALDYFRHRKDDPAKGGAA